MKNLPQSQFKNEYFAMKRRFENSQFVFRIYTVLALFAFVFICMFGVTKLYKMVQTKRSLEKQLIEINSSMRSNLDNFAQLQKDVLSNKSLIASISIYMPAAYSTEEYMLQLSEAVSKTGFTLRRVNSTEAVNADGSSYIVMDTKLDGPGNPVELINNIEKLKRITRITGISYTLNTHASVKGDGDITLGLEIYNSGESQ